MALDQAAMAQAGQRAVLFMRSLALRHEEVARKLEASQEVRLHCSEKPCGQETGVGANIHFQRFQLTDLLFSEHQNDTPVQSTSMNAGFSAPTLIHLEAGGLYRVEDRGTRLCLSFPVWTQGCLCGASQPVSC